MKRIVVTHYGGPDSLQVVEEERPEPLAGQVRVKVLAAGVALPDITAREGILRPDRGLRGPGLASGHPGRRQRFRGATRFGLYIAPGWLLPGHQRVLPYSIQWRKRRQPRQFREDLATLLDLLRQHRIKPLVAQRLPLVQAQQAQVLLGQGGITGTIVLVAH